MGSVRRLFSRMLGIALISKGFRVSEYQYYEWQALERPSTASEQAALTGLSSHIDVTSGRAIVGHGWSDFKYDPIHVLAEYFDAHLYIANWGARRLAFRFSQGLLDTTTIESCCDEYHVQIQSIGDVQVLEFEMNEAEGFDAGMEERGLLSTLACLRDDFLQGDHRNLYLAWLKARSLE